MSQSRGSTFQWAVLGEPPPDTLTDARLQLHYAAQIVSSVGFTFGDPVPDFNHTNMGWVGELGALASWPTPGGKPFQAALRFQDLTLLFLGADGKIVGVYPMDGRTIDDGYQWLQSSIETHTGRPLSKALFRPDHELPPHPAGKGTALSSKPTTPYEELSRWYANADRVLREWQSEYPAASPVRCWPHHFDIAFLIHLDAGKDAEESRTIGVGLSPGDESYQEPYFYISPYPYPEKETSLPALAGEGHWHTEDFIAAVLPASKLVDAGSAAAQLRQVEAYVQSAIEGCHRLLGAA
jgi:hypothetical protein